MAPKHHPTPLSGGDRKALTKELGRARAMTGILAAQSAEMRAKAEAMLQQADRLLCESWNERMWADGEQRYDGNKKHGANYIPREFEPTVRAWCEEDTAAGIEWVFHKRTGERYGVRLCNWTWQQIFKDAGLPEGKTAHKLKDLAVAWADCAEVHRSTFAAHAATLPAMLDLKYGPSLKVDQLELAAEQITQKAWRERGQRRAAKAEKLAEARSAARSAPDAIKAEARRAKERANSAAVYAAEKARAAAGIPPKTAPKTAAKTAAKTAPPAAAAGNVVDIATRRHPPVRRRAGGDGSA